MGIRRIKEKEPTPTRTVARRGSNQQQIDDHAWDDPSVTSDGEVARLVVAQAATIEKYSWSKRWSSLIYARYLSGRETVGSYAYSTSARPGSVTLAVSGARWRPPTYSAIGTVADVYSTRIFKNRPFVDVIPLGEGGFKGRLRSTHMSKFSDAVFDSSKFWSTAELIGTDAMEQGVGIVKIHEDPNKKGSIAITRVLADELLISDDECLYGEPHSMLQRVFMHRRDVMARYGKSPEAIAAIKKAPAVHSAFGPSDPNLRNIISLIEGWSKPLPDGTPGKHVLCIPGHAFINEKYTKRFFPFAILRFKQLTTNWKGQGLVEQLLPLQSELDRCMASYSEANERLGYPFVFADSGSDVSVESMAGMPGTFVTHTGPKPQIETPPTIGADSFQWFTIIEQRIFKRAGISEAAAGGVKPQGLNSGAALMAFSTIEDTRHVDLSQRFEDWVTEVAKLVFSVAEEIKPKVVAPGRFGRIINWEDVRLTFDPNDLTSSAFRARAFPMSRLPQGTVSGREQQVSDWLANGQISREQAMRAGLIPDTESLGDLQTAVQDQIDATLDRIIDSGKFIAPTPFGDLALTLQTAQSRYLREDALTKSESPAAAPADRLRLLLQFIACTSDLISDRDEPQGPVGVQGAPAPLAPAPLQVPAAQAAPLAA